MKRTCLLTIILSLALFQAFPAHVAFQNENYNGAVMYNETASYGGAVFARLSMKILRSPKKKGAQDVKAVLQLYRDDKRIETAQFYFLNSRTKRLSTPEMLAAVPVGTEVSTGADYSLKIIFSAGIPGENAKELILPLTIKPEAENPDAGVAVPLEPVQNPGMTAERVTQQQKLLDVIETVDENGIFSQKAFVLPLKNAVKASSFAQKRSQTYSSGTTRTILTTGNEYQLPDNTEIFAVSDGRVRFAEFAGANGWTVAIEHLPGLYSVYKNLGSLNVREGESVRQGEKIALSGSGQEKDAHPFLWEVRLNGAAVSPEFFLQDFALTAAE